MCRLASSPPYLEASGRRRRSTCCLLFRRRHFVYNFCQRRTHNILSNFKSIEMRHLCYLIFVIVVNNVQQGCCLHCYSCSSLQDEKDCDKPVKSHLLNEFCNQHALNRTEHNARKLDPKLADPFHVDIHDFHPQIPTSCLKQVLKVGDRDVVLRGCQLSAIEDKDICLKIQKMSNDRFQLLHCSLCNTDYCNVATYTTLAVSTLMLPLLVNVL